MNFINKRNITASPTLKYAFVQGTYWISQCAIGSFAVVYLHANGYTNTQIGIILSIGTFLSVLLQVPLSAFADKTQKISLKSIIILLMFISLTLAILLYIAPLSFLTLIIVYILLYTIQSTIMPLLNSLALEPMNKGVFLNYGLARGTGSISYAIASFLIGLCINQYGPFCIIPIFIVCNCFTITAAFLFRVKFPDKIDNRVPSQATQASSNDSEPSKLIPFLKNNRRFVFFLLGAILLFYSQNIIGIYLINIIEKVGGNSADMGVAMAITAAVELPTMASFILLVRKIKCDYLLKAASFFFLVKVTATWLATSVIMIHIAQVMQIAAYALFAPASVYYVNLIISKKDSIKGQALLGAALCLASAIASITGGALLDTVGVSNLLMISTIVTAFGFLISCFSIEKVPVRIPF